MRRHVIGIIAILLLLGGAIYWISPPNSPLGHQVEAACWRLGPLLVMLWIAYPQLHHMPSWLWAAVPVLAIVLARWPKLFLVTIPLVIALAILQPRMGRKK